MSRVSSHLGTAGNCASVACAIHCVAIPLAISFLPALGLAWLATRTAELSMIWTAIGFSALSLCWGYRTHRSFQALAFVVAAAAWFFVAFDDRRHHLGYSLVGGACLIAANLYNRHLCKSCHSCNHGPHPA